MTSGKKQFKLHGEGSDSEASSDCPVVNEIEEEKQTDAPAPPAVQQLQQPPNKQAICSKCAIL